MGTDALMVMVLLDSSNWIWSIFSHVANRGAVEVVINLHWQPVAS